MRFERVGTRREVAIAPAVERRLGKKSAENDVVGLS